jgi:glycosyltransferase involved in cell wall biosynthesis
MVISFVIPTLNEATYLSRCVDSIRRLERPSDITAIDILVVDTGSTDDTLAVAAGLNVRALQVPGVTVACARNCGAQKTHGDALAFVDADCELPPDWLVYGLEHLRRSGVVAMGTSLMPPPATATWVERHWHRVAYAALSAPFESVHWLPTSNLLVWRDAFNSVDGFNDALVTCEDCDFGYRLALTNTLVLENRVRTSHLRESRTVAELFKREWWRGLGNFRSWRLHGWDRREFWSAVGPLLFVMLMPTIVATALLATPNQKLLLLPLETIAIAIIPSLMLKRRGLGAYAGASALCCSYLLVCVYLCARAIAVFNSRRRLEPVAAAKVQWDSRI